MPKKPYPIKGGSSTSKNTRCRRDLKKSRKINPTFCISKKPSYPQDHQNPSP